LFYNVNAEAVTAEPKKRKQATGTPDFVMAPINHTIVRLMLAIMFAL